MHLCTALADIYAAGSEPVVCPKLAGRRLVLAVILLRLGAMVVVAVIVVTVSLVAIVAYVAPPADVERLIKPEGQDGFGWNTKRSAACENLATGSGACAGKCTNSRPFTTSCKRADYGPE
jgi:hypothetical protein